MNFIQLSIEASEETQEILISTLSELDATGFEQTNTHLLAYFNEDNFRSYDISQALTGYPFQLNTIKQQNWNKVWESNFQPVSVDDFCYIRADFHKPAVNVQHEIIITPKMSFGTGHHATTYMMIEQMREIDFENKTVFDFGTGTGILAILAEKLGASSVTAIDIDEWSIENAKENFARNQCSKISIELSSQIPQQKFDIILANINRNVILQYLPLIRTCMNENGLLLLSGLLLTDKEDIVKACSEQQLSPVKQSERQNWISLLFNTTN